MGREGMWHGSLCPGGARALPKCSSPPAVHNPPQRCTSTPPRCTSPMTWEGDANALSATNLAPAIEAMSPLLAARGQSHLLRRMPGGRPFAARAPGGWHQRCSCKARSCEEVEELQHLGPPTAKGQLAACGVPALAFPGVPSTHAARRRGAARPRIGVLAIGPSRVPGRILSRPEAASHGHTARLVIKEMCPRNHDSAAGCCATTISWPETAAFKEGSRCG